MDHQRAWLTTTTLIILLLSCNLASAGIRNGNGGFDVTEVPVGVTNPATFVQVFTHSDYDVLANILKVQMWWIQQGGPEPAKIAKRELIVTIDGNPKIISAGNFTNVPVPWNYLDGRMHNITVTGVIVVNWTTGPGIFVSDTELIIADNSTRALILYLIITSIVVISIMGAIQISRGNKDVRSRKSKARR